MAAFHQTSASATERWPGPATSFSLWRHYGWQIEEFHKAQKTGLDIEGLQFTTEAALQPAIAMLSVVAVGLLQLREAARDPEQAERPAAEVVDPVRVRVLSLWRYGEERPLTVREYTLALGRLGGHLNRKCDGLPGWQTLWKGANQLHAMVSYELSRASSRKR